ncbi:MBL fold metallo-hydrolase [Lentibacillus sp. L22]|uniref:MBL fold metallo-hydrolase n=1 Tax=Lentibacillus TaxID=175304 RepID=UPI0022B08B74|nr:MBL fold metallo-hydrolase [Lentibacillus daqui]
MKVTVIGYWGGFPGVKEATSGYLLQHDGFHLLLDCGSGVLAQLQAFINVEELDAVLLSHYHHDHVADIGPLQFGRLVKTYLKSNMESLPIYGHALDSDKFNHLTYKNATTGIAYDPDQTLKIGPFMIEFIETKHPVTCYAMRITAGDTVVVYTADTSMFPELVAFSKGADLLISECSLYQEQDGLPMGHMNSVDVGQLANDADVSELLLTHLPHYGDHQDLLHQAKEIYHGKIALASTGWTWGCK